MGSRTTTGLGLSHTKYKYVRCPIFCEMESSSPTPSTVCSFAITRSEENPRHECNMVKWGWERVLSNGPGGHHKSIEGKYKVAYAEDMRKI